MALHLIKLSVGARNLADLARRQAEWGAVHTTRNTPRRAEEILDGGSIYWVIDRLITARQALRELRPGARPDGAKACQLVLDPVLVPVRGRLVKPFQGWRYLEPGDAPPDAAAGEVADGEALPAELQRELARLGLM